MYTKRNLKNGDVFRVVENSGSKWMHKFLIQAKESNKNRYYVVGGRNTLEEAVKEMNRRADEEEAKM